MEELTNSLENKEETIEEAAEKNAEEPAKEGKESGFFSIIAIEIKNKSKKGRAILAAIVICGILIGFAAGYGITTGIFGILRAQEKEFSVSDFSITLNESFEQYNLPLYSVVYASNDVTVYVNRRTDSIAVSAEALAQAIASYNDLNCQVISDEGLTYFMYVVTKEDGKTYANYTYVYKNNLQDGDFWIVEFSVEEKLMGKYTDAIKGWAGSVELK